MSHRLSDSQLKEWKENLGKIDYDVYMTLPKEQKSEILVEICKRYENKEISEKLGISLQRVYNLKYQYITSVNKKKGKEEPKKEEPKKSEPQDITNDLMNEVQLLRDQLKKVNYPEINNEIAATSTQRENSVTYEDMQELVQSIVEKKDDQEEQFDGMSFNFSGIYRSDLLTKKLMKVLTMIEDEPNKFEIELRLKEIDNGVIDAEYPDEDKKNEIEELKNKLDEYEEKFDSVLNRVKEAETKFDEKINKVDSLKNGYESLKTDKSGLHHPKSEYEGNVKKKRNMTV